MKLCTKCNTTKELSAFRNKTKSADGKQTWCTVCMSAYERDRYHTPAERVRKNKNRKASNDRSKAFIWAYLSENPCVDCGEADPVVLEFDHKDEAFKVMNITDMFDYGVETIKNEIDKCDVRCANCHRRRTMKQFNWWKHSYNSSN